MSNKSLTLSPAWCPIRLLLHAFKNMNAGCNLTDTCFSHRKTRKALQRYAILTIPPKRFSPSQVLTQHPPSPLITLLMVYRLHSTQFYAFGMACYLTYAVKEWYPKFRYIIGSVICFSTVAVLSSTVSLLK